MVFLGAYVASIAVAGSEGLGNGTGWLLVPAVGPWVAMSQRKSPCEGLDSTNVATANECAARASKEAASIGMLVVDGLVQSAALVAFGAGVFAVDRYLERQGPQAAVVAVPLWTGSGVGVGLAGRF